MIFDQTYIAIRKRNVLEILDLSLHVIRDHALPLLVLWAIGIAPFLLADWLAIRWMAADIYDAQRLTLFLVTMILLVSNQAQVATTFMTSYLGQSIFMQRPSISSALKSATRVNPWFFWVHGVLRMVIPVFCIACLLSSDMDEDSFAASYFLFVCLVLLGLLIRCVRPFATEILLLEKTPVRRRGQGQINYSLRSSSLHKAASSDLTGRFILMGLMSFPFFITFLGSLLLIDSTLNLHSDSESTPVIIYVPVALWLVAGLMAVTRFLSYIDIRIRQEGWEVELRMRAEAIRLEKASV